MPQVKIECPKCHQILRIGFRTPGYGHGATDEALAVDNAIKNHRCKPDPEEQE